MSSDHQEHDEPFERYGYREADQMEAALNEIELRAEAALCSSYQEYLKTAYWHMWSERIRERDLNTCQDCGDPATEVHHLEYPKVFGDEDPDNLISICRTCHAERHGKLC